MKKKGSESEKTGTGCQHDLNRSGTLSQKGKEHGASSHHLCVLSTHRGKNNLIHVGGGEGLFSPSLARSRNEEPQCHVTPLDFREGHAQRKADETTGAVLQQCSPKEN